MSGSNAISGIVIVGAILATTNLQLDGILGFIAVIFGTINVVGGFLVTDRMLKMFKKKSYSVLAVLLVLFTTLNIQIPGEMADLIDTLLGRFC